MEFLIPVYYCKCHGLHGNVHNPFYSLKKFSLMLWAPLSHHLSTNYNTLDFSHIKPEVF